MESRLAALAAVTPGFQIRSETLKIVTRERVELLDITPRVAEFVRDSDVRNGIATVNSRHTTLALFVNEFQEALLDDVRAFLEQLVSRNNHWKHNDPRFSDCERANADGHLRAMLLGHGLTLPVREQELVLGAFQAIILAELDGPRERTLEVQVLGLI
jgi:secondary thiamine-phosphate synthase enzyme